jgi:hypothetical protein
MISSSSSEKGRCEGPKPYGHTPEEAEILKRVRYMRRRSRTQQKRRTFDSIAEELNREGITTRQGKRWNAALVYNILNQCHKGGKSCAGEPNSQRQFISLLSIKVI